MRWSSTCSIRRPRGPPITSTRTFTERRFRHARSRRHATGVTVPFVTHSIQEAMVVGDGVVMLGHAPSEVVEVLDVSGSSDPDSERFLWTSRQLRKLLAEEGEEVDDASFE